MKSPIKFMLRLAGDSTGSALVEMTIVVPVAISMMAGVVDFGMAFATQATGGKSLRDAGRYLSTLPLSAACGWGVANGERPPAKAGGFGLRLEAGLGRPFRVDCYTTLK